MKRLIPTLPHFLGSVLLVSAAALVGWKVAGGPAAAPSENPAPEQRSGRSDPRHGTRTASDGAFHRAQASLSALKNLTTPEDRMRAIISLVWSLPLEELGLWLERDWFDTVRGFETTLFYQLAEQRWATEDPEGYLRWKMTKEGQTPEELIAHWAEADPALLLKIAAEMPGRQEEIKILGTILTNHPELAIDRFLQIASTSTSQYNLFEYLRQFLFAAAHRDPHFLEKHLSGLPDSLRVQAQGALSAERLKISFGEELGKLISHPDGWRILQAGLHGSDLQISGEILSHLHDLPASWKNRMVQNPLHFVSPSSSEAWIKTDLEAAGFTPEQASQLYARALHEVARRSPGQILEKIEEIDTSPATREKILRLIAVGNPQPSDRIRALLGQKTNPIAPDGRANPAPPQPPPPVIDTPANWLSAASGLSSDPNAIRPILHHLSQWDERTINELRQGFDALPDENKQHVATLLSQDAFERDMPAQLRGMAIHHLLSDPSNKTELPPNQLLHSSSHLAVRWLLEDPVAASRWTDSLPEGDAKLWAQKNVAANWSLYDPEAAGTWIKSLPPEIRSQLGEVFTPSPGQ